MAKTKRAVERTPITTSCDATFECRGRKYQAWMVDLSPVGAGFLIFRTQPIEVAVGDVLHMDIKTALGPSKVVGEVKWLGFVTSGVRFGVKFDEIAPDDPLIEYAESPF